MSKFLSLIIIILSLQSWAKADSIKELDIEGFTIGESLFNYFSKEEILKNTQLFEKSDNKFASFFTDYPLKLKSFEQYEYIRITYLNKGDFIIHGITGMRDYKISEMSKCYKLQKEIEINFDNQFSNLEKKKDVFPSRSDPTGESKITAIYYVADDGIAEISCYDFADHAKIVSGIDVAISTDELGDWLISLREN
tara:strand:- start:87 stop:671 length:585 start_codon:yes stop_codon:yes gene_type:complete